MTRFIFEIDVVRKDDVKVVESYAKRALERRIISVDGYEFFTIASVREKGENEGDGFSEATIRRIKAREDERQQKIAEEHKNPELEEGVE